jgi:predicted dehydrogenase
LIILIIGLGSIATKHVMAIRELYPNFRLVALRHGNLKGNELGIEEIYSIEDSGFKPDFILISNPTNLHKETIEKVLFLNVPLFIEKPLFSNLNGAKDLVDLINQKKIITYVGCNLRFNKSIVFLRNIIRTNKERVNEVNIYCGSYLPDWRPGRNFREIYSANSDQGGGVHLDLIHEIDFCYWIFGKPLKFDICLRNKSSLEISASDYADYRLTYPNFIAGIRLNYFRKGSKRELEILTDRETYNLNIISGIVKTSNNSIIFEEPFNVMQTYQDQMKYFIDCINNGESPMNSVEEALDVLKICLNNE